MAKPKMEVLVAVIANPAEQISVWIDNAKAHLSDIASIEGVKSLRLVDAAKVRITVDMRYDKSEVAQELRELLTAEVPSIFREDGE